MAVDLLGMSKRNQYNPSDPFAGGFGKGSQGMLREAGRYGYFSPEGSPAFRATARRRLLTQGRSRRNRSAILARLAGLDPMRAQQSMIDTDMDIAGDTSDALNDFDFDEYRGNRDWFRGRLGDERGFEEERRARKAAERAQRGAAWGQIGGSVLGSLLPF